ncbi:hypothetical protein DBR42_24850, partial [Pelomonas sp. HMWF004]
MRPARWPRNTAAASRKIAAIATSQHHMSPRPVTRHLARHGRAAALLALALAAATTARAHGNPSEASAALSLAPVVLSVGAVSATGVALSALPVGILSAGVTLVVVSV